MFSEYQDIDLEEDPIFVLPCNHIFTMSTMDGWLDINQGYRQDQNGKWSIVSLPMQFSKLPVCPDCRFLIRGLRRYGRICNQASLNLSEKCFITSIMKDIESLRIRKTEEMNSFTSRIDSLEAKLLQKSQKLTLSKHLTVYKSPFEKFIKEVFKCFQKATKSPQKKVYESCVSHLDETESNSFLAVPKPHLFLERSLFSMLIDCKVFITKFNLILYNRMKSNSLDNFQRLKSDYDKDMEKIMTDFDNYLGKTQETGATLSTSGAEIEFHRLDIEGEYLESIQEANLRIPLAKDLESRFDHFLGRSPISFLTKCVTKLDTFKTQLLKLNDSIRTPLTLEEKQSIATAINFQGTWYNCPNGHPYAIGECGGAMEVGTCYECGVRIGGSHHTSLPGNVRASFG
ncbi:hypothetical protein HDV02_005964 [Globomyces sp. JEL0801]|nr:hypothetical protein HDV02_005964 [Globomyces sp. JEL0801]